MLDALLQEGERTASLPSISPSNASIMSMLNVSQPQINTDSGCDGDIQCHRSLRRLSEKAEGNAVRRRGTAGQGLAASHLWNLVEEEHLFTTNNSNLFKRKDYQNDVDCQQANRLSSSPAQRRCQTKGPQAVPDSENLCLAAKWTPRVSLYPLQALAQKSCWERAGQREVNVSVLWGSATQLPGRAFCICLAPETRVQEWGLYV